MATATATVLWMLAAAAAAASADPHHPALRTLREATANLTEGQMMGFDCKIPKERTNQKKKKSPRASLSISIKKPAFFFSACCQND